MPRQLGFAADDLGSVSKEADARDGHGRYFSEALLLLYSGLVARPDNGTMCIM